MKKTSFREKFSYAFDRWMARGLVAMIGLLFLVTVIVTLLVAVTAHMTVPDTAGSIGDALWKCSMRLLDAGNVIDDYGTGNLGYILLMIAVAVCGLFVTSALIGLITSAFQARLERLRRGNSRVLEKGHTLILGADDHLTTILSELVESDSNRHPPALVLLSKRDRCEMEELLTLQIPSSKRARIICRSGDPTNFQALRNTALDRCAHVIALGGNDFEIIKEILAARTLLDEGNTPDTVTISAVIREARNLPAAQIAGGNRLEVLFFDRLIARIFAQTSRQTGLAQVYQDLFDFQGDEIYMEDAPSLEGKPFAKVPLYYRNAAVLGLAHDTQVQLNPPGDQLVQPGDQVVLIEREKGAAPVSGMPGETDEAAIRLQPPEPEKPLRLLVIGYNHLTEDILQEISRHAITGSILTLVSCQIADGESAMNQLRVRRVCKDVYGDDSLDELLGEHPDCVIVLSEPDLPGDADARTLTILLQLSHHYRENPEKVVVVSEMLSKKNQALATCSHVNDFVIGSNLAALVLTQVSQNRLLRPVFEELLTDRGNEIYIRPVRLFIRTDVPINLYTLAAAVGRTGQLLLGLRIRDENGQIKVLLNPDKAVVYHFQPDDCAVVLAQD